LAASQCVIGRQKIPILAATNLLKESMEFFRQLVLEEDAFIYWVNELVTDAIAEYTAAQETSDYPSDKPAHEHIGWTKDQHEQWRKSPVETMRGWIKSSFGIGATEKLRCDDAQPFSIADIRDWATLNPPGWHPCDVNNYGEFVFGARIALKPVADGKRELCWQYTVAQLNPGVIDRSTMLTSYASVSVSDIPAVVFKRIDT
jgi:hypothetical protein